MDLNRWLTCVLRRACARVPLPPWGLPPPPPSSSPSSSCPRRRAVPLVPAGQGAAGVAAALLDARRPRQLGLNLEKNREKKIADFFLTLDLLSEVSTERRRNSRWGNFGSPSARVSGRDFRYSWQGLLYRNSWRNLNCLTRTADFIRGRSAAVLFNIWKPILVRLSLGDHFHTD